MELFLLIILVLICGFTLFIIYNKKAESNSNNDYEKLKEEVLILKETINRFEVYLNRELKAQRSDIAANAREDRNEMANSFSTFDKNLTTAMERLSASQRTRLEIFNENLGDLINLIGESLKQIRQENTSKLDEIKVLVDDKLKETIEKRFQESFSLIGQRLEQVHKGLSDMQSLANGVGDLKKVLSNVKMRGNIGEMQLESILSQILSPEQYVKNAQINPMSQERVEFAIKLPGKDPKDNPVLLPIDSKFPLDVYQTLLEAYESNIELDKAEKGFISAVKKNAMDISQKYIMPPYSTDFAVMFVPTEGLYAEIIRRNGLFESLRNDFHITVVGPVNLAAFLSSLCMGFRTLAIEKRSSEVWNILSSVKTEFGKFGDILEKTHKKLLEAANTIDSANVRSRAIERRLKSVENQDSILEE